MGARNMDKHFQGEETPSGKSQATQGQEPYTHYRQSVKAVRVELSQLKEHTPMRQESDARPPDSSPKPPGPDASSKEARPAGLPPLPDVVLFPPPPSLLSGRAGGPVRLRESHHSLHRYCNIACTGETVEKPSSSPEKLP